LAILVLRLDPVVNPVIEHRVFIHFRVPEVPSSGAIEMKKTKKQSPMLIEERRQHILSLIQKNGRVLVDELSSALDLSKITIRKDLDYLQSKDLIVRSAAGTCWRSLGPDDPGKERAAPRGEGKDSEGCCGHGI
jgi:hypothetical protein